MVKKLIDNSLLAFHSDCVYSIYDGKYFLLSNSHIENTAAVMYFLGNSKKLNWKKEIYDRKKYQQDI